MIEQALELLLGLLLAATAAYCALLYRRLVRFRDERAGLEAVIARLVEASERAEAALSGLAGQGAELARLGKELDRVRALEVELRRLVERADDAARRLDTRLREARATTGPAPPRPVAAPYRPDPPRAVAGATAAPGAPAGREALVDALRALR